MTRSSGPGGSRQTLITGLCSVHHVAPKTHRGPGCVSDDTVGTTVSVECNYLSRSDDNESIY